ncbi:low temperature requirement protein A [Streptomyces griseoincarnatus]
MAVPPAEASRRGGPVPQRQLPGTLPRPVYVVLVGQAAHTLAEHFTWRGTAAFAVVLGLIWIAWLNGTLFHELHGREDGHTRSLILVQMLLSLMAVCVGHADGDDGRTLAVLYAVLLERVSLVCSSVDRMCLSGG